MLKSTLPTFLANLTIKKLQVQVSGLITYLYVHIKGWLRSECAFTSLMQRMSGEVLLFFASVF